MEAAGRKQRKKETFSRNAPFFSVQIYHFLTKEHKLKLYYFPRYCFPDTRIGQPVAAGTKCIWQCPGQSSYHQVKHIPTIQQPVQVKSLTNKHSIGVLLDSLRNIRSSEPKSSDSQSVQVKSLPNKHSIGGGGRLCPLVTLSPLRPEDITSSTPADLLITKPQVTKCAPCNVM